MDTHYIRTWKNLDTHYIIKFLCFTSGLGLGDCYRGQKIRKFPLEERSTTIDEMAGYNEGGAVRQGAHTTSA